MVLSLWKGYPLFEVAWEPELHLINAPGILVDYLCHMDEPRSTRRVPSNYHHRGCRRGVIVSQVALYGMGIVGVVSSALLGNQVRCTLLAVVDNSLQLHHAWPILAHVGVAYIMIGVVGISFLYSADSFCA